MNGLLHTVMAGANVGIFSLAAAAFALRFLLGWGEGRGGARADRGGAGWLAGADRLAYATASAGLVLGVLTGLTGVFTTWPLEAIRETILTRNKVGVTATLMAAWGMFVLLRWRVGPELWSRPILKGWSAFLVLVGFAGTVLAGSMGGSASLKGTILEPLLDATGVNRFQPLALPPVLSGMVIVGVVVLVWYSRRPARR
jgi:hypothetical protein